MIGKRQIILSFLFRKRPESGIFGPTFSPFCFTFEILSSELKHETNTTRFSAYQKRCTSFFRWNTRFSSLTFTNHWICFQFAGCNRFKSFGKKTGIFGERQHTLKHENVSNPLTTYQKGHWILARHVRSGPPRIWTGVYASRRHKYTKLTQGPVSLPNMSLV